MEPITKDDLRQLRISMLYDIEKILDKKIKVSTDNESPEWLRSKSVRHIMNISPATLQNIRVTGKIRFKKIMGSYYYSRTDLLKLFENDTP